MRAQPDVSEEFMLHSDDLVLTNAFKERQEKGDALVGGAAVTQNVLEGWTAGFLAEAQQIVLEVIFSMTMT